MKSRYYVDGRKLNSGIDMTTLVAESLTCKDMVEKDNHESEEKQPQPHCLLDVIKGRRMKQIDLLTDEQVRNFIIERFSEVQTQDIIQKCQVFYDPIYNKLEIITDPKYAAEAYEPELDRY
jgi:hypothetical protein